MKAFRKTLLAIFFIVTLLGMNSVYATTVTVNSSSEFEAAVAI